MTEDDYKQKLLSICNFSDGNYDGNKIERWVLRFSDTAKIILFKRKDKFLIRYPLNESGWMTDSKPIESWKETYFQCIEQINLVEQKMMVNLFSLLKRLENLADLKTKLRNQND